MGFSVMSFLIWIFNPISVIRSLMWDARNKIPVLSEDPEYGVRQWHLIRKWGLRTLIILSLYLLVIVVLLGWTFRWYPAYLVLQTFCFIVLDRYLIAVNYDKKNWKDANEKTKREIKIIRVIRIPYIVLRVMFGLLMILMIPFANITDYTIETWLYFYKAKITTPKGKLPESEYPFGSEINMYEHYKVTTENNGKTIIFDNYAFYERKLFIFMKGIED